MYLLNHIGPQFSYPVPEGILNFNGNNYLALNFWSQGNGSVKLDGLGLQEDAVIESGHERPALVEGEIYTKRDNSY